jgi:demethoxyubiquinone hydroxylase (CLK1/Coq7/Cat5 family)
MKVKHLTKDDQKRYRYIKSLLALRGDEIELQDIAKEAEASGALVSQVIRGHKKGVARNGKKIAKIKQLIAAKLGKPEEELFPRKAA